MKTKHNSPSTRLILHSRDGPPSRPLSVFFFKWHISEVLQLLSVLIGPAGRPRYGSELLLGWYGLVNSLTNAGLIGPENIKLSELRLFIDRSNRVFILWGISYQDFFV